jgi:hypothetical protein
MHGKLLGGNIVASMALDAHCIDLVALEADVRRRGTNIFIVGVTGAQTMAADTRDLCPQMRLTQLFLDERYMAHITGCVGA